MGMASYSAVEIFAAVCFACAILHTFSVSQFLRLSHKFATGSVGENIFHLLGEVEVVFGVWAAIFVLYLGFNQGMAQAVHYLESCDFTEPAFVFVVLAVCATRPILGLAGRCIELASRLLPLQKPVAFYVTCLILGPLIGSFVTEPAAMTVTAMILLNRFFARGISSPLKYATLGLLFVNISIGGTLTPYAAPPILMVASKWNWDLAFMLAQFGWKACIAVGLSTALVTFRFRKELAQIEWMDEERAQSKIPVWVSALYLLFLAAVVMSSHHLVVFTGIFLFFLGLVSVTREYQDEVRLREGLLVAFFLGGLVVLGGVQRWWLEPLITQLDTLALFLGGISLTAFTDNAALTYLGAQVPTLSEASRYYLVAGAVTGGGLTVIANAPNPAGYGILNSSFGAHGISPLKLFASALTPTIISALCFWFL